MFTVAIVKRLEVRDVNEVILWPSYFIYISSSHHKLHLKQQIKDKFYLFYDRIYFIKYATQGPVTQNHSRCFPLAWNFQLFVPNQTNTVEQT